MEKDILSTFITNEITLSIVTKLYRWALVLLLISSIYWILDLMNWYTLLKKTPDSIKNNAKNFVSYKLRPVISVIGMALSVIGHILNYKGYGHVLSGIKSSDSLLLNKGFKNFYTTYILAFISYSVLIIYYIYKLF